MNEEKLKIRFICVLSLVHFRPFLGDDVTIESIDIGICSINYEMKNKIKPINEQLPEEN